MIWVVYSLVASALWGLMNILDRFIIDKYTKGRGIGALVLFSSLIGVPVCAFLFIFFSTSILSVGFGSVIFLITTGVVYLLATVFYLYAIWSDDLSNIVPQFLLIPVFSFILGFLFLNEVVTLQKVFGSTFIILGAFLLNTLGNSRREGVSAKKLLFFLVVSSFLFSLNAIMFKFGFLIEGGFVPVFFWEHVGFILFGVFLYLLHKPYRNEFNLMVTTNGLPVIGINLFGEVAVVVGNFAFYSAITMQKVGLVNVVAEGFQPFFVFVITAFIALLGNKKNKRQAKSEELVKVYTTRLVVITMMVYGLYLLNV